MTQPTALAAGVQAAYPASRFSLARPAQLVANGVLLGAISYSLQPFMGWLAAVPIATVLTYTFSALVHIAVENGWRSGRGAAALAGALFVGTVTTSLSYATFYARTSAQESARREYLVKKERTERETQRVVNLAASAFNAMNEWSKDAAEKSAIEGRDGNTCPLRESDRRFGPIANWRKDEAKIAGTLAGELKGLVDAARTATDTLAKLPAPDDFKAIKAGYAALNAAIDASAALSKGGYVDGALKTAAERRSSQIDHPNGRFNCGDSGRLSLIERATVELGKLNDTPVMARLTPSIDLDKPMEIVTRGLVRGANITASAMTFGLKGNFDDDPLLKEAVARYGWMNRETVPYLLSLLAEAGVLLTGFVAARTGRSPFRLALPDWVRDQQSRQTVPGWAQRWMRRVAKLVSNLFWVEPAEPQAAAVVTAHVGSGSTLESSGFAPIELVDDPTVRQRERQWASRLAPWHHGWGMDDWLVLPIDPVTRAERHMARALGAHGLAKIEADGVDWNVVSQRAPVASALRDALGDGCEQALYQLWRVTPAYGHLLRLATLNALTGTGAPDGMSKDQPGGGAGLHGRGPVARRSPARGLARRRWRRRRGLR